jgi:hypothetical protein
MPANSGPAALTRPGPDTEGTTSMHEPTYLTPRHLLIAVQATGDVARTLSRRLDRSVRDGAPAEIVERRAERLRVAVLEFHSAILLAAAEGATSRELVGYGVSRDLAAELDRRGVTE